MLQNFWKQKHQNPCKLEIHLILSLSAQYVKITHSAKLCNYQLQLLLGRNLN